MFLYVIPINIVVSMNLMLSHTSPHYKYTLCHNYSKGADSITGNVSVKGIPKVSVSPLSVSETEGMEYRTSYCV